MNRVKFLIWAIVLLVSGHCSGRVLTDYTTDKYRTNTLSTACIDTSRAELFEKNRTFDRSVAQTSLSATFFNFDADNLIETILKGGDAATVLGQQMQDNTSALAVNWGFFVVPIVILFFLLPSLCCCCICPDSCPVVESCRQPKDEEYTPTQMTCPAVFIAFFSIILILSGIIMLLWRESVWTSYRDVRCNTAIIFDDFLNGNVTSDEKNFFIGLETLSKQLNLLNDNLATIENKIDEISSDGATMNQLYGDIDDAKTQVSQIPTGISGQSLSLTYGSPISDAAPLDTATSTLNAVLGSQTDDGLVKTQYDGLEYAKTILQLVSLAADGFEAAVGGFNSGFQAGVDALDSVAVSIGDADHQINVTFNRVQYQVITIILVVFYVSVGLLIISGILTLAGTLFMWCCDRSDCRGLMYAGCTCLSLMGFVSFLLALFFSITAPVSYFGCTYLETGFESQAGFKDKFSTIIGDPQTVNYVSQCLPSESGEILEEIIGADIYNTITQLDDLMGSLDSFDPSIITDQLVTSFKGVTDLIGQYRRAQILDITKTSDINILKDLADPSTYSSCGGAVNAFNDDSWVPSVSQSPVIISCQASSGEVTPDTCSDITSTRSGCVGCMDTFLIFQGDTFAQVKIDLDQRYPDTSCQNGFNTDLMNVWKNFYAVKQSTISGIESRSQTADNSVQEITTQITDTVTPLFNEAYKDLTGNFSTILDEKYGLIGGLNCRVLGQDVQLFVNTFCNNMITLSYFLEIVFGMIGYITMFIGCCSVCLGVRHYRKEQAQYYDQDDDSPGKQQQQESAQKFRY